MNGYVEILIPLIAAFLSFYLGIKYSEFGRNRQQIAILILFIEEFTMLLKRCSMYYYQSLKGGVSFSTLFESSDSATFTKLAEVTGTSRNIQTAIKLKSNFFQVIRYADKASEVMNKKIQADIAGDQNAAKQAWIEAQASQQMALNFFMGDQLIKGKFHREKYKKYIEDIRSLLNDLERLNTPSGLRRCLIEVLTSLKNEKATVDKLINDRRIELKYITEKIELLREKEKLLLANKSTKIVSKSP